MLNTTDFSNTYKDSLKNLASLLQSVKPLASPEEEITQLLCSMGELENLLKAGRQIRSLKERFAAEVSATLQDLIPDQPEATNDVTTEPEDDPLAMNQAPEDEEQDAE